MARIKIVQGNIANLAIKLEQITLTLVNGAPDKRVDDFVPNPLYPVKVIFMNGKAKYEIDATMDGSVAHIDDKGTIPVGIYDVEVRCRDDQANPMRFKQQGGFEVVEFTKDAGIDPGVEFDAGLKWLDGAIFLSLTSEGGAGPEVDPAFSRSPAAGITQEMIDRWNSGGVEDTTARAGVSALQAALASLRSALDTLMGTDDITDEIDTYNEIKDFLDGFDVNDPTLVNQLLVLSNAIAAKYTKPSTGIPSTDLAQAVQTILNSVANKANSADVYPKSQTYSKSEVDAKVADAGKVKSVSINDGEPVEPDSNGNVNIDVEVEQGADGVSPHIDQVTGHWFIGNTDTNVSAQGPQGNSGVSSGDEVVVVNNLDGEPSNLEQGQVAVLSAEMGKELGLGILAGGGTFADAYDKSKEDNVFFPWMLRDADAAGNAITKMIWHVGNKLFVDAFGTIINGKKNGITAWVSAACDMKVNGKTFNLVAGENNISLSDIGATNNQASQVKFYDSGTDTENKSYLTKIDFGGFKTSGGFNLYIDYKNLVHVYRAVINMNSWSNDMFSGCSKLEDIELSGSFSAYNLSNFLKNCTRLIRANLKDFNVKITSASDSQITSVFASCSALKEADIRGFDTSDCKSFGIFSSCNSLKKLTIGNFSNESATYIGSSFNNTTGCTLICTTSTPPVLKNCAFADGVAQDEYSNTYDWIQDRFSAIYVPSDAVQAYKTNTYIENGTVGNTGWSKYASIIYDIAEYDG